MEEEKSRAAAEESDIVMASWLTVDEETSMELSKLLESFGSSPPPVKVRFVDDPYSSGIVFQSSSAYVTINGNEESCGSSFSDSDSSVMASIDLGGVHRFISAGASGVGADESREWRKARSALDDADVEIDWNDFLMDGCDSGGGDDGDTKWMEFLGEEITGSL